MRESRPIIPVLAAALLLLLPVLYVGSYAALVKPNATIHWWSNRADHYRWRPQTASRIYWPLEQVDRRLRPRAWEVRYDR
jgi:hypothetical protein